MAITVDTNRIMFPTQRRFNAAWREMSGERLRLLPRVASEIMHRRIDTEFLEDEVERAEAGLARVRNSATEKELLKRESDLWWAKELLRDDSPYELISLSREQRERAEEICEHIDPRPFTSLRPEEVPLHDDTMIIAQALVSGQQMLITGNMRSIEHDEINYWAERHAATFDIEYPDVLYVQDEIMPRMYAGTERKLELCAIGLGAAWPFNPGAGEKAVRRALKGMLGAMHGARLENTGICIESAWREAADPDALLESVRRRLPEKMRASERTHPVVLRSVRKRQFEGGGGIKPR